MGRGGRIILAAIAVLGLALATQAPAPTTAAWEDPAFVVAQASAANPFPPAPVQECTVIDAAGNPVAGITCEVDRLYGTSEYISAGVRVINVEVHFSISGPVGSNRILFTVDLRRATSDSRLPPGWQWPDPWEWGTTDVRVDPSSLERSADYSCADLPWFSAIAPSWAAGSSGAFFRVYETGRPGGGSLC